MAREAEIPDAFRASLRLLEMVGVLHGMGYERLRIMPYMAPSGCAWRCSITHALNIDPEHGAMFAPEGVREEQAANYSSASEFEYFGWPDASDVEPEELARKFLEGFPELCELGRGSDPDYVAWFQEMLETARQFGFPIAFADWPDSSEPGWMETIGMLQTTVRVPPPPPRDDAGREE